MEVLIFLLDKKYIPRKQKDIKYNKVNINVIVQQKIIVDQLFFPRLLMWHYT